MKIKKEKSNKKSYARLVKTKFKIPTKKVYVCSPYRGDIVSNTARAISFCRFVFDSGYIPFCPHIYYTQFLCEDNINERKAGLKFALNEMWQMRELWAFGDKITEGMAAEIELAKDLKIKVRHFNSACEEVRAC